MSKFISLHNHTHYSLLDGLSKPSRIAEVCSEYKMKACAITDHGNIAGVVEFHEEMNKKNIKPILGCELYINNNPTDKTKDNKKLAHLVILAKNKNGWDKIIQLVSRSNEDDVFYYKPRISTDMIKECSGDIIAFSGHPGSEMANVIFSELSAYDCKTIEDVQNKIQENFWEDAVSLARKYEDIFGKGNFFLEIQLVDSDNMPASTVIAEILRKVSLETGIPCVATGDSHYPTKEDYVDHRILLCSGLQKTLKQIQQDIRDDKSVALGTFFKSENYYIPSYNDVLASGNTEEEIQNSVKIAEMCEAYDIVGPPQLPIFEWTDGKTEEEYIISLCRKGWIKKKQENWDEKVYAERVKEELKVFNDAGLNGYFLIVQDYVNYAKNKGWLVGPGRGSCCGSLVSYLLGITEVDPIKYGLIFSRFFNKARAYNPETKKGSLPDIDMDFSKKHRKLIIEYIRDKYGRERVCQMVTFGRLMGRGAVKEILRIHSVCDHITANKITKYIPDEADIDDKLEDSGETSIINWTLDNMPHLISDYCTKNKDGKLEGNYARYFEQAIRIEGTLKTQSKHAAGIVISKGPLNQMCPMIQDKKGKEPIAGYDMGGLEKIGGVKYDILGILALDRLQGTNDLLRTGKIGE
jgi:DNA polymerase-3 subunit alpha